MRQRFHAHNFRGRMETCATLWGGEYVIPHERPPECLFEYWGAVFAVLCVPLRNLCHQGVGGHWKCSIKRLEVAPPLLHNVRSSVPGTLTEGLDTLVIDFAAMYVFIFIIIS